MSSKKQCLYAPPPCLRYVSEGETCVSPKTCPFTKTCLMCGLEEGEIWEGKGKGAVGADTCRASTCASKTSSFSSGRETEELEEQALTPPSAPVLSPSTTATTVATGVLNGVPATTASMRSRTHKDGTYSPGVRRARSSSPPRQPTVFSVLSADNKRRRRLAFERLSSQCRPKVTKASRKKEIKENVLKMKIEDLKSRLQDAQQTAIDVGQKLKVEEELTVYYRNNYHLCRQELDKVKGEWCEVCDKKRGPYCVEFDDEGGPPVCCSPVSPSYSPVSPSYNGFPLLRK